MERGLLNARGFIRSSGGRSVHSPKLLFKASFASSLCKPKKLFGTATQIFRKRTIFIHVDGRQEELVSTVNLSQLDMYLTQKGQRGASLSSVVSDVIIRCPGDFGGALRIADLKHADGLHEKLSGVDN
ncbi:hypothetical protein QC763_0015130 [Podospora pseudopauciseta]|uniref:Uncharacterized protein n=1 Tax=Podospora pseudopauciseta TaxID=2093780 RepID=A0ABR0HZL8_9PEZI|nr:hypothetical protein QC763_0015130 [Podospora pseudopauciseta]